MRCEVCGEVFTARADARFCSGRCRVAHHRGADGPPAELTTKARWVLHRKKVPFTPFGAFASVSRPDSWRDYATAKAALADKRAHQDGVGFVLNGDGIACLDLDDCLHDGVLADWAQEIVDRCPRTYIEISPSGHGLHIFGYATVGKGRIGQVEVYDRGRYICITGRRFGSFPRRLADISAVVASV